MVMKLMKLTMMTMTITDEQGSEDGKDGNSDKEDGVRLPYITHTVIFKCIGSNREES